jgi:hypothetical protein
MLELRIRIGVNFLRLLLIPCPFAGTSVLRGQQTHPIRLIDPALEEYR